VEQGAATQEIARSVEIAAQRTGETAAEVGRVSAATSDTRASANAVRQVADDLGVLEARIRSQVAVFFDKLQEISPKIAAFQGPSSKAAGM
jgi:methyl-accepting chemotaxis protein